MNNPAPLPMTTTASPDFRTASGADLAAIKDLLRQAGLPFEDIEANAMPDFVVLRNADAGIIAAGGLERYGSDALLRSVVVCDEARGQGLGVRITRKLEERALQDGISTLYLLTNTAAGFFPRLGYESFDRNAVPAAVAASREFAQLCPASASCLRKKLETAG